MAISSIRALEERHQKNPQSVDQQQTTTDRIGIKDYYSGPAPWDPDRDLSQQIRPEPRGINEADYWLMVAAFAKENPDSQAWAFPNERPAVRQRKNKTNPKPAAPAKDPTKLDDEMLAVVMELRGQGISVRAITKALNEDGIKISREKLRQIVIAEAAKNANSAK